MLYICSCSEFLNCNIFVLPVASLVGSDEEEEEEEEDYDEPQYDREALVERYHVSTHKVVPCKHSQRGTVNAVIEVPCKDFRAVPC